MILSYSRNARICRTSIGGFHLQIQAESDEDGEFSGEPTLCERLNRLSRDHMQDIILTLCGDSGDVSARVDELLDDAEKEQGEKKKRKVDQDQEE